MKKDALGEGKDGSRVVSTKYVVRCLLSVFVGFVLFAASAVHAASISLGDVTAVPAQPQVVLPLSFTAASGEQVTAFSTDIHYDPAIASLNGVTLEPTLAALGKQISTHLVAPGHMRIVVYGTDRQGLPSGTVAQCLMQIPASAALGSSIVSLQNGLGSGPTGIDMALFSSDGRLWIALPQDTTTPQISDVIVSNITLQGATVSWQTNELSRSTLTLLGTIVNGDAAASLTHQAVLSSLASLTLFNFTIVAVDESGNESTATTGSFTTLAPPILPDLIAPVLTLASPEDATVIQLGAAVSVSGTAEDNRPGVQVSVNGAAKSIASDGSFSTTLTPSAAGNFAITVRATDTAGNATVIQRSITVEQPVPAVNAPTVLISNPVDGGSITGSSVSIAFSVQNATLAVGGVHLTLNLDNGPTMYLYGLTPYGWSNIAAGTHTIRLRLVDANHVPLANSEASDSMTFSVGGGSTTAPPPTSGSMVTVISPVSASTVSTNTTLKFSVQGVKLSTSSYHLHVRLDNGSTWHVYSTDPLYLKGLTVGQHKVTLQLVDKNHALVSGSGAYAETTFKVAQ